MGREGRIVAATCIVAVIGLSFVYAYAANWREVISRAFDDAVWVGLIMFLVVNGNSIRGLLTGMQLDRTTLKQIEVNLENLRLQQDQIRQNIRLMELQHAELQQKLNMVQVADPDFTWRYPREYVSPRQSRVSKAEPDSK